MSANLSANFSRYDQKLEFILRNAARIFAEKGYHSTTMRDISRETQVSLAGGEFRSQNPEFSMKKLRPAVVFILTPDF